MPRPILLFTGPFSDRPLDELAAKASEWGYAGLELATWGDHFEIQRAAAEPDYCQAKLDLLARHDLQAGVLAAFRVSTAVGDIIDGRHQPLLPDYIWGNGDPAGVQQRATEEMLATAQMAEQVGISTVSGFLGSPLWSYVAGWPGPSTEMVDAGFDYIVEAWAPILERFRDCGVRYAFEVHPGQIAFDLYSTERLLDAFGGREEFGLTFDPSHLLWQGIDPAEFLHRFADRIYHVHIKDAIIGLNGRAGLLSGYWPSGDRRRGWQFRSPGHGGVDWEAIIRALHQIRYDGPLSVDWHDPDMDRDAGAEDACKFVQRLDFEPRT